MTKIAVIAFFSVFIATPVQADNTGKFYAAVDMGAVFYHNVEVSAGTYPPAAMFHIAGGYHFNPMLAAEAGYSVFDNSTLSTSKHSGTVSASSSHIAAVVTYPLTDQLNLIGKLGLTHNEHKIEVKRLENTVASMRSSQSDVLIGFGVQYNFNPEISVRTQYENFGKFGHVDAASRPMKATALSIGVIFNF